MTTERAYVYILANHQKRLYTGMTARLRLRIIDHKQDLHPQSHTARYNIHQLVYYEIHLGIVAAIRREKQIKGWLRIKKIQLIVAANPTWRDLFADLPHEAPPFDESKLKPPTTF